MKKKIVAAFACVAVLAGVLAVGGSYSWLVSKDNADDLTVTAASIAVALNFEQATDPDAAAAIGIPGARVAVTGVGPEFNTITNSSTRDCIFKVTYSTENALITGLDIKENTSAVDLIPAGVGFTPNVVSGGGSISYYGRLEPGEGTTPTPIDLGQLCATFAVVGDMPEDTTDSTRQNEEFTITAEIEACQATEDAVADYFGIDDITDPRYAPLFEEGGTI